MITMRLDVNSSRTISRVPTQTEGLDGDDHLGGVEIAGGRVVIGDVRVSLGWRLFTSDEITAVRPRP